jgi:OFA family oxalate/formate antiporter-like MFS transporter
VRWFPNRKGLVTGIAVAGFGGGAALVSQLAGRLLETFSPFEIFRMLGVVFGVTVLCAGSLMRFPPGVQQASAGFRNIAGLLTHQTFRTLYLAMVVGLAAGFAVNANLRELAPARAAETGILAVSAFAVANALGRILWGVLSDRIRPELALRLNLLAQAVVLAGGLLLVRGPSEFVAFASGAGFNYGGVLVLYASTVAKLFGAERVGEVYGLLFTANIVASPAPMVCGYLFDFTGSFAPALGVLIVLLLISTRLKFQHAGTENV